ncbi:RDD family protein, partial [Candidatus Bathyarchaeota archaeon]|nr:RDD family protein [Candidatus Bathyarchaeota archaeon]
MSVDQENISRILSVLSHSLRREILLNLSQKSELSFTDLMNSLNVDTGKLSFHIRGLVGFIDQTPKGKYRLTQSGENALRLIRALETWAIDAQVPRSDVMLSLAPLRRRAYAFMIDLGIVFSVFAIATLMSNLFSFFGDGGAFHVDLNVIFFVIVFWVYCTLLEGFAGQTIGKRVIGLVV